MTALSPNSTSTSVCASFLQGPKNATSSYCALPSCFNNTAVMSHCCTSSEVVPYQYNLNISSSSENQNLGNALWCSVANESMYAWNQCVDQWSVGQSQGLCASWPVSEKSGSLGRDIVGSGVAGKIAGLVGLALLLQEIL